MADLQTRMTEPVFRVQYRILYADTDAGRVVYNANYLRFFEIGRSEMMRSLAMANSEIEQYGVILPVTESYLRYKAPARYDDLITIATSLVEIKKVSCRFHYRITCDQDDREQLLVKGFTNHACVNRQGRLTPFPEEVHISISKIQNCKKEQIRLNPC
jgi:acyl-CoA thioester hydrolase